SSFVFKLDIYANKIISNLTTNDIWPSQSFIPHALDVADTWAVVAGYGYEYLLVRSEYRELYQAVGCLIDLSQLINASCVSITSETYYLVPSNIVSYNELYELSVAIRGQKVLIGISRLSTVVILYNSGSFLNVTQTHLLSFISSPSIGRVVDWADNTTIAILVENEYETSWSTTQIYFYDENLVTLTSPIFTFPNNQQIIGTRLLRPSIARFMITVEGNMAMITGGTYKNYSSLGPCSICPSGTRNLSISSIGISQCISCSSNLSCPLASLSETNLTMVSSYSQAVAYPETTDATDIEDFLIKTTFQIDTKQHCLLISPLFWTFIVGGLCLLYLTFILLTHLFNCKSCIKCHKKAKIAFKHTDIINEGEMWIGGLATLAIIVLAVFACWFSASFLQRYPIEDISQPATFACDESLINAQFSTGLKLLAIPKSIEAQPIFNLLDKQTFNLTVELINTGFTCSSITAQENLLTSKYVALRIGCNRSIETAITSVTFTLPKHLTTVQVNIYYAIFDHSSMANIKFINSRVSYVKFRRTFAPDAIMGDLVFYRNKFTGSMLARTLFIGSNDWREEVDLTNNDLIDSHNNRGELLQWSSVAKNILILLNTRFPDGSFHQIDSTELIYDNGAELGCRSNITEQIWKQGSDHSTMKLSFIENKPGISV
ncbi:unnamed protein product, partial [Rotaria sordida]